MAMSLGRKISELRRNTAWTQEELTERLGVSPQAVSKWENDVSCPDILLLPQLAGLFGVTVDELLSRETPPPRTTVLPPQERKKIDDMMLRVIVNSGGDKVRINLPMILVKLGLEMGWKLPQMSDSEALKNIDFEQIMELVERGLIGRLVEVKSSDGDTVEIVVE